MSTAIDTNSLLSDLQLQFNCCYVCYIFHSLSFLVVANPKLQNLYWIQQPYIYCIQAILYRMHCISKYTLYKESSIYQTEFMKKFHLKAYALCTVIHTEEATKGKFLISKEMNFMRVVRLIHLVSLVTCLLKSSICQCQWTARFVCSLLSEFIGIFAFVCKVLPFFEIPQN